MSVVRSAGSAAAYRGNNASSVHGSTVRASIITSTRCASSQRASARRIPSCSTTSGLSRSPAVSMIFTGRPSRSMWRSTTSRVVPGRSLTIAASSCASRLRRLDLPAFTWPSSSTDTPSRKITPCSVFSIRESSFSMSASTRPSTWPSLRKSISSSGKSIAASTYERRSNCNSTTSSTLRENSPRRERAAPRTAACDDASMRSATASACARSMRPLRKARKLNSPGRASRAPALTASARSRSITNGPP